MRRLFFWLRAHVPGLRLLLHWLGYRTPDEKAWNKFLDEHGEEYCRARASGKIGVLRRVVFYTDEEN